MDTPSKRNARTHLTRPYTRHPKSRALGRGSNAVGRGSEECRIHDSISHMQLGRSSDAKTARKTPKKQRRDRLTDRQTDRRTDTVTYRVA